VSRLGEAPAAIDILEEPVPGLSELREVTPPAALVARVMTHVAEPASPTFWQWLRRPYRIEVRLSPLGTLLLGLGLAVGTAVFVAPRPRPMLLATAAAPGGARGEHPVLVRFVLEARGARQVAVAGSFNEWNTDAIKLEDLNHDGMFVATVPLPPGLHEYMFVVDGQWVSDPTATERRPDGFGRQNSLLRL
jgi:hypothetical protein